jgi:hypothetical protein
MDDLNTRQTELHKRKIEEIFNFLVQKLRKVAAPRVLQSPAIRHPGTS